MVYTLRHALSIRRSNSIEYDSGIFIRFPLTINRKLGINIHDSYRRKRWVFLTDKTGLISPTVKPRLPGQVFKACWGWFVCAIIFFLRNSNPRYNVDADDNVLHKQGHEKIDFPVSGRC